MSKQVFYESLLQYQRSKTNKINVGGLEMGGDAPIRLQSMTNTNTLDTNASVRQCAQILDAGGELVRLTAQGVRESENLKFVKEGLVHEGYNHPVVADIHFNSRAAFVAAKYVDKVRINPGNFIDPVRRFDAIDYTEKEYEAELEKIRKKFVPFLDTCFTHNTAIRIGVNHGSLSDRIMSRFGDTAAGMVEACMEYLRIAVTIDFRDIVISIKSSNTRIMVHTVRLLVATMKEENMYFPIHLGVTEAGEGEDGRIKSAVGIGALLADGIGDTIRVSLSEEPEVEIPVGQLILDHLSQCKDARAAKPFNEVLYQAYEYTLHSTVEVAGIGGDIQPVVIANHDVKSSGFETVPDLELKGSSLVWHEDPQQTYSCISLDELETFSAEQPVFVRINVDQLTSELILQLKEREMVLVLATEHKNSMVQFRSATMRLSEAGVKWPIIFERSYDIADLEAFQVAASIDLGGLFLDGFGNGIWLNNSKIENEFVVKTAFGILQASRSRMTKTEFISCPGCGRTLFQLKPTIDRIKAATSHLKGLKIGIMGCIVNGPGEMADADYGFVGAGKGTISLYKGKECLEKNIPQEDSVERLTDLIKREGDWKDPE